MRDAWSTKNRQQIYAAKNKWIANNRSRHLSAKRSERKRSRLSLTGRASRLVSDVKRRTDREFNLTTDWAIDILKTGLCQVTKIQFDFSGIRTPFIPSIDRIDSSKGYTKDNSQIVIFAYNLAKDHWSHNDVMLMAKALIQKNPINILQLDQKESDRRASRLIGDAKKKHRRKNNRFSITTNHISLSIQSGKCAVTGLQFDLSKNFSPFTPSLDQIRPSCGYTKSNTQVVSLIYNLAKGNWSHDDVIKMASALILEHRNNDT